MKTRRAYIASKAFRDFLKPFKPAEKRNEKRAEECDEERDEECDEERDEECD